MDIEFDINEKERAALEMEWRDVDVTGVKPKDKKLLNKLASTFMLTNSGRPGELVDEYSKLERNQDNHIYLANIAKYCLDHNFPFLQISQLLILIQDLDATLVAGVSPYTDEFQGFQKWNHPDFEAVRLATAKYMKRLIDNPSEKKRAYKGIAAANEKTITEATEVTNRVIGIPKS